MHTIAYAHTQRAYCYTSRVFSREDVAKAWYRNFKATATDSLAYFPLSSALPHDFCEVRHTGVVLIWYFKVTHHNKHVI